MSFNVTVKEGFNTCFDCSSVYLELVLLIYQPRNPPPTPTSRKRASRDHDLAMVLFQVLLENLDIQHSRFVQEESFLLKHNIRRYKQNFQV